MSDELLDRIDEVLAAGEPDDHGIRGDQACPWCGHDFHGLPCVPDDSWLGNPKASCRCDTSLHRLDDTWRPDPDADRDAVAWWQNRMSVYMHERGIDGWAADELLRGPAARRAQVTPADLEAFAASVAEWLGLWAAAVAEAFRGMAAAFGVTRDGTFVRHHLHIDMRDWPGQELAYGPVTDEPDSRQARMARALHARRHRNTGPPRPTANQSHRPRRTTP